MRRTNLITRILLLLADFLVAAALVAVIWIGEYKLPQKGVKVVEATKPPMSSTPTEETDIASETAGSDTSVAAAVEEQDWHIKFADKFTDEVVSTDTSYSSPNLAVELSYHHYDTGIADKSTAGKNLKYGTEVSYVVADIYIGDITCFRAALAQDTYGVGYTEKLSEMSARMQAVLAVNGDSYSNNRHEGNGTVIRNGVPYREQPSESETCVLNWDGTMDIYAPRPIDMQLLVEKQAYQSWIFGPSLLDENGKAKEEFLTWDYIRQSHPRTAIGYYEPGHYCLVVVDGRQKSTRGMFLSELAQVFEQLGCKVAYNLDGGHFALMLFQNETASNPFMAEEGISDGIFITEGF